ncbi:unnamed protein product [Fusarium equiseti]|uniref:Heterokaryon incompatibility domain-containing protein n=1 Tax=Fusarium equiseti TaxID=61235 RepID=A0A8J2NBH9_FUSEQ|nr:unnamed protein product [Fusarium equiseti]
MECPQFTVLDEVGINPDFAKPKVDWDRHRLWYRGLSSATNGPSIAADKNGSMDTPLPKGFCLVNVPEARLVETDGVQIPKISVVQDDENRKSAQLEAMGRIYSKASFTIVSSEPSFISQGLPGVSQPRVPPLYLCVGDKVLVPRSRGGPHNSTWETRGWTYQEGLLSENVIIFDQDMAYMYSRASEKVHLEGFRDFAFEKPNYISASLIPDDEQYSDQVNEYSKRLLTFGSDKINGFLGVLNTFRDHQCRVPNRIIDQAMLWHYTYEPARSGPKFPGHEFPSWSWASTVGRIQYRHLPSKERPLFSVATWATVELDQSSNKLVVKVVDCLQPGQQSEAQQHLTTIRDTVQPLEGQSGYDPVAVAMAANLCERYRLIQRDLVDEIYKSATTASENNLSEFSRWKIFVWYLKNFFGCLGSRDQTILQLLMRAMPFKKAPWFQTLGQSITQVPQQARVDTLLRLAKPSLPNLLEQLSTAELEAALKPGRIVVRAPKRVLQLKYTQLCFKGTQICVIGYGRKLIGIAELTSSNDGSSVRCCNGKKCFKVSNNIYNHFVSITSPPRTAAIKYFKLTLTFSRAPPTTDVSQAFTSRMHIFREVSCSHELS